MSFDEKTIRTFSKTYQNEEIKIHPYYEIKVKKLRKIINTKVSLIALIIEYPNGEYYLQFLNPKDKIYKKEIIEKFAKSKI